MHRFFVHHAVVFPSGAHLHVLHSSLNDAEGSQVKSGLLCSCCDTMRTFDDGAWLKLVLRHPLSVHAAKPWIIFMMFNFVNKQNVILTRFTAETRVAILSPWCSGNALLFNLRGSLCSQVIILSDAKHHCANSVAILCKNFHQAQSPDNRKF